MYLHRDRITGDELVSDVFKLTPVDDIVVEADAEWVTKKEGDVDIGANPSAEEQSEGVESSEERYINLVRSHQLQSTQFNKKSYMLYLRGYFKALRAEIVKTNPERIDKFEKNASAFAKKILANFDDYEFYTGESMNPEGMVVLLNYRKEDDTPYFTFWADGLSEKIKV